MATPVFVRYQIAKGAQYCDKNTYKKISCTEMKFIVKFDSSAIYTTLDPGNQNDINKLYGFSDNNRTHHEFSARIGWRWSNNALRLFGYVYNNSVRRSQEICTGKIGEEIECTIKVIGAHYLFSVGGQTLSMPRTSTTPAAEGYQLYPYFGGDETAPHSISIWIKDLQ